MKINQKGAVLLLFTALMTALAVLFFATSRSFSMFSLKRKLAVSDTIKSIYQAESKVNDIFARFFGEYNLRSLPNKIIIPADQAGGTQITINLIRTDDDSVQEVIAKAGRVHATTQLHGFREEKEEIGEVDIVLALDCTGSMDAKADNACSENCPTRFDAQKDAAISFINSITSLPDAANFHLGFAAFGVDAKWIAMPGVLDPDVIKTEIENGFGSKRENSPICLDLMDATSVGSGYAIAYDYFNDTRDQGRAQVVIVITDGEPNSRIIYPGCNPNVFCPGSKGHLYCSEIVGVDGKGSCYPPLVDALNNCVPFDENRFWCSQPVCAPLAKDFLKCTLDASGGVRDSQVDAYGVTIYSDVQDDVRNIFDTYATGYYPTDKATELPQILQNILEKIIKKYSNVKIIREVPF